jgi:leucyl-tRNA synthetase
LQGKFEGLMSFATQIIANAKKPQEEVLEKWLQSRMQRRITEVTASLDEMKTRSSLQVALFEVWNDLRWYIQRRGNTDALALRDAVKDWLKMLAPFAPFMCEELWSQTGDVGFISLAAWPQIDASKVDVAAEEHENLVQDILADTQNILKAMKIEPKTICYYTAAQWKWQIYLKVLQKTVAGEAKMNELMREFSQDKDLKPHMKEVAALVPKIMKNLTKLSGERKANMLKIGLSNQKQTVQEAGGFLKERFNAAVQVYGESDADKFDPKNRASNSLPNQPAIYIE